MIRTTFFPGRYIQGPGALETLPQQLAKLGARAVVVLDDYAARALGPRLQTLLGASGQWAGELLINAPNSETCTRQWATQVQGMSADMVLGVGGGKVLDAAKVIAELATCPLVVVPTVASTDAPCSSVAVMQTDAGAFSHYRFLRRNPELVLVDTTLIASAPLRMLVAGIGDALSTWFEARESQEHGWHNIAGTPPSPLALAIARQCYETVRAHAPAAVQEHQNQSVGEAFERIVEANILLSGLGFESGGLGTAHAIQNGLNQLPACRGRLHGELVTLGLLAMLQLNPDALGDYHAVRQLAVSIGLPVCLAEVGLAAASDQELLVAARFACTPAPMNRVRPGLTPEAIVAALRACH